MGRSDVILATLIYGLYGAVWFTAGIVACQWWHGV